MIPVSRPLVLAPRRAERGMALFIALIVLLVVSILGVAAMRSALFQSRVSINSQTENLAFQAAESGLTAAFTQARTQITAGIFPGSPAHLFNMAMNVRPQRVCLSDAGIQVYSDGVRDAVTGAPNYTTACPVLANSNTQVTTVVGPAPADSAGSQLESFDQKYGGSMILIQVRSYGEVPNTNVRSVHAQDWGMLGPSDSEGG